MISRYSKPLLSALAVSTTLAAGFLVLPYRRPVPPGVPSVPDVARVPEGLTPGRVGRGRPVPAARWAATLDRVVQKAVQSGPAPGLVVLVEHRGQVVYRKAAGYRSVVGRREPMTPDTVFDLASLTKAVATTSAVMALVEDGQLSLEDRVDRFWPEFAAGGKGDVTIRQLLTHTAGLPAWIDFQRKLADPAGPQVQDHTAEVLAAVAALPLRQPPDQKEVYSDLGFISLGEVVRRVTGQPLDVYVRQRVFAPLGMKETTYNPGAGLRVRIAPTTLRGAHLLRGEVHDPNAAMCGGVAGHAGLFSTVDDLARFARMLLSSDEDGPVGYPLKPQTVRLMSAPAAPEDLPLRGLGWDIDSPYCPVRDSAMPLGSFGHVGFTGTFLWVDPYTQTFVIALSNRVHPREHGNMRPVWSALGSAVARLAREDSALSPAPRLPLQASGTPVLTGLDELRRQDFQLLRGRKVGLISSAGAVTVDGLPVADLVSRVPGLRVARLFTPAHNVYYLRRLGVAKYKQRLPVQCICGAGTHQLGKAQLKGLDTLLFDAPLSGSGEAAAALQLAVKTAAAHRLKLVVLDRPDVLSAAGGGPALTVGELAGKLRGEAGGAFPLEVVRMEGWRRPAAVADSRTGAVAPYLLYH